MKLPIFPAGLAWTLALLGLTPLEAGMLRFDVRNTDGEPLACRIQLADDNGVPHAPLGAPAWGGAFLSEGQTEVDLPPGRYAFTVEKGPEWSSEQGIVEVTTDAATREITLNQISDLGAAGWYAGDLHVHRPPEEMDLHLRAEGLAVASIQTWWNKTKAWGDETPINLVRGGPGRRFHVLGGEDERGGGAVLFHKMDTAIDLTGAAREWPASSTFLAAADAAGAWVEIEKPFWWDIPLWLASRKVDSIGIAHNHMHRAGVLDNEAWGRPRDRERYPGTHGNGLYTQDLYYRILNAGLRIPPSAGSASGVLPNPVGHNRVYVQTGERFDWNSWWEGLRAGRCFVTNGPLLRATANGAASGEVFRSTGSFRVTLDGQIDSRFPIRSVELVTNGTVREISLPTTIEIRKSGWFLVRAIADDPATFRFASTAPWYVEIDGEPMPPDPAATSFFLQWAEERRDALAATLTDAAQRREVVAEHEDAVAFWRELASEEADTPWPVVESVDAQPLLVLTDRLVQALDAIGEPLPAADQERLWHLADESDPAAVAHEIQRVLDPHCLAATVAETGEPLSVVRGPAAAELFDNGWRNFLVKVVNHAGARGSLQIDSEAARPIPNAPAGAVAERWLDLNTFTGRPLARQLSGLALEYRIVQIYARPGSAAGSGNRVAPIEFAIEGLPGSDSPVVRRWRFDNGTDGWGDPNQCTLEARDGSLHVDSSGSDPFFSTALDARGGRLVLRFWAESDEEGVGQFFWWNEVTPQASPQKMESFSLLAGGPKEYEIEFEVEGRLAGLRLDPNGSPGHVRIDWIDLAYASGTGDGWAALPVDWTVQPTTPVTFAVADADGSPCMGAFIIRDRQGRIYPPQSKRLAPDFFFQSQIYRESGETIHLPPGTYQITCSHGPESVSAERTLTVGSEPVTFEYQVERWIDTAAHGYWSGDHHIHAAGCLHYSSPTEGVHPPDMLRHIMGEDCKVGCCLTWGPCFDYQKQFFTGKPDDVSRYPYLLRYDIEVSGFGSHNAGHLNLLRLTNQIPPGGESKGHWPTLGMNTLRWAKLQGAVTGTAHSGAGLTRSVGRTPGTDGEHRLPNYDIPAMDGIGACEFVMQVTHKVPGPDGVNVPAIDFIATMNTPRDAEWNMWYHVLNCGFPVVASGETDFPCMSGERVAMGRVYVQLEGRLEYDRWIENLRQGKSYVSDGRGHLMDFVRRADGTFAVTAAARTGTPDPVSVELVVNGRPVEAQSLPSDGRLETLVFEDPEIATSSWVAARIHPLAHTNPIVVRVDDRPVRASRNSARWCLAALEQCWKEKSRTYAEDEFAQAEADYAHARQVYEAILAESVAD